MGQALFLAIEKKVLKNRVSWAEATFFCRRSRFNASHIPGVLATAHTPCKNVLGWQKRLRSRGKSSSTPSETDRTTKNGMPSWAADIPIAALSMSRLLASLALPMARLSWANHTIFLTVTNRPDKTVFSDNSAVF